MNKKIGILLLIFFVSFYVKGQEIVGLFLPNGYSFTRIPFKFYSNLIIVPIRINDSDTLNFVLDSGVSSIILTDHRVAEQLQLPKSRFINIMGIGEGGRLAAYVSVNHRFEIGKIHADKQNIIVLEKDLLELSEFVGYPIHGIIGYDLFKNFVVTIDFDVPELICYPNQKFKYKKFMGEKIPISIEAEKPYTQIVVSDSLESYPLKVLLDTGAGHALLIESNALPTFRIAHKNIRSSLGKGLGGLIMGLLMRSKAMKVGSFEINNLITSFPDSTSGSAKFGLTQHKKGNVGCEFFKRFRVTFDYANGYMALKPNRRALSKPFEHNMSGMELQARGKDFEQVVIDNVTPNSPAALAGLQEGDQLIFVNGKKTANLNLTELYQLFQKGEGKELLLLVKRKEQIFLTSLVLKRLL